MQRTLPRPAEDRSAADDCRRENRSRQFAKAIPAPAVRLFGRNVHAAGMVISHSQLINPRVATNARRTWDVAGPNRNGVSEKGPLRRTGAVPLTCSRPRTHIFRARDETIKRQIRVHRYRCLELTGIAARTELTVVVVAPAIHFAGGLKSDTTRIPTTESQSREFDVRGDRDRNSRIITRSVT